MTDDVDQAAGADPAVEENPPPAEEHGQHLRLLEALLFASPTTLNEEALAERLPDGIDVPALLRELAEIYASRGVNLVQVAGGWAFRTAPDLADKMKIETAVNRKLSRAAVETLAIIAYHQPITRAEIEEVRGVGLSKGTLDLLFEQGWIAPMGRRRAPGKPVTWGTTAFFLEHFGLPRLDDLPGFDDLKAAGLLDPAANITIYRPEEPDLPLEEGEEPPPPLEAGDEPAGEPAPPAEGAPSARDSAGEGDAPDDRDAAEGEGPAAASEADMPDEAAGDDQAGDDQAGDDQAADGGPAAEGERRAASLPASEEPATAATSALDPAEPEIAAPEVAEPETGGADVSEPADAPRRAD